MIKKGSKGAEVSNWQQFLISRGHSIKPDGDFGPATDAASRAFQRSEGLPADGVIGPNTYAAARSKGFTVEITEKPTTGKVILVSAGHTNVVGQDRGAAGNGFIEGVEAVTIRDRVAALLRQRGRTVLEDGADGVNEPLTKAIALARKADVAIEIHFNAGPPTATGIEVLSKPNKKALAQKLAGAIRNATGLVLRGESGWKSDSSGQHHRLGFCEAGGLILEIAFISNPNDMRAYKSNFTALVSNLADVLAEV